MHSEEWKRNWKRPVIEHNKPTPWNWMVSYPEMGFDMGDYVDIGAFTYINAMCGVVLCDDVQIGSHCAIYSVNSEDGTRGYITIGERARIGSHCVILPGANFGTDIGDDAIVGAFSLVKQDIPAREVWVGIPAKSLTKSQ